MSETTTNSRASDQNMPAVSPRLVTWFARYLRRYFARSFDAILVSGEDVLSEVDSGPLVIYSNHPPP